MIYWQFLFLSNQSLALLALFLDLLHQTGVTLKLRLPYGKRFLNMRFTAANIRELIAEDHHTAAQFFQPLRNGGDSTGNQCGQLLDFGFQLPQQRIVCLDLPVQFAAVRDTLYNLNYGTAATANKVTIKDENVAIEVAIDRLNASQGTIAKAKAVFANMGVDGVFGRSDIAAITKDSVTAAGNLITKLKNADLIEPVSGFGKGKYKFISPKE